MPRVEWRERGPNVHGVELENKPQIFFLEEEFSDISISGERYVIPEGSKIT